jgi:hypothetical protein
MFLSSPASNRLWSRIAAQESESGASRHHLLLEAARDQKLSESVAVWSSCSLIQSLQRRFLLPGLKKDLRTWGGADDPVASS